MSALRAWPRRIHHPTRDARAGPWSALGSDKVHHILPALRASAVHSKILLAWNLAGFRPAICAILTSRVVIRRGLLRIAQIGRNSSTIRWD